MRYRLFQYSLPASPELEDLNEFIASRRIASVSHHLMATPGGGLLVFVVESVGEGATKLPGALAAKVDYRELLSPTAFGVFKRLRDERKKWADAEGVPVYAIFTNAQLAAMVQSPIETLADLRRIEGLGPARLEKYGQRLLAVLGAAASPSAP